MVNLFDLFEPKPNLVCTKFHFHKQMGSKMKKTREKEEVDEKKNCIYIS